MSPRTDLCDTCQQYRNSLQYNVHQEKEAKDLLKKSKDHFAKAKIERNYYNKNTKLAEEQRKLVDQSFIQGKISTVKPEITQTLGGHQILWVITGLIHYVL